MTPLTFRLRVDRLEKSTENSKVQSNTYYANHRAERLQYGKVSYEEHTEKSHEATRDWRSRNPERTREIDRKADRTRREKHRLLHPRKTPQTPEQRKAHKRRYYQVNKVSEVERVKAYWKSHPEKAKELSGRHRARKSNAAINDFTTQEWTSLKAAYHYRCAYCGIIPTRLTQDHLQPISQGGNHTLSNIVPCCPNCNSKKGTGPPLPFHYFLHAQALSNYWLLSGSRSTKLRRSLRSLRPSSLRLRSDFLFVNGRP